MEGKEVDKVKIKRALISVWQNRVGRCGHVFKRKSGVALLSTGDTVKGIADTRLPVTEVSDFTGFPEILNGRVKSLHPKIMIQHWRKKELRRLVSM